MKTANNERNNQIIKDYQELGSISKVAKKWGVSRERVRQITRRQMARDLFTPRGIQIDILRELSEHRDGLSHADMKIRLGRGIYRHLCRLVSCEYLIKREDDQHYVLTTKAKQFLADNDLVGK